MTSAIVIKNILLFVLIVLIGHFLVKNFLVDKEPTKSVNVLINEPTETQKVVEQKHAAKDATEPSISKSDLEPEGLDKAKAELLKFVDEEETGTNLNKYFKETSKVPTDDCKSKIQTSQFPLSTTCNPDIQVIDTAMKTETPRKPQECTNLTKNVLVLNEYDNENTMNGGELFNGLNAFDSYDNHFQLLT
jgi:hypothetical protein